MSVLLLLLPLGLMVARADGASALAQEPVVAETAGPDTRTREELAREVDELRAALQDERAKTAELRDELAALRREVARALEERIAREREWLRYTKMLRGARPEDARFDAQVEDEDVEEPEATPEVAEAGEDEDPEEAAARSSALERRARRDREIHVALRSLLVAEEVSGLDLLTSGTLGDGWIGPVVFRVLDEWGRPLGSISAERLRFEGSRAARTLTIVLEEGYERRMGERIPFDGPAGEDVRRIVLPYVDPGPWMEDVPELFDEASFAPPADDGRWDLGAVRMALNELLRLDAANGWYRVRVLGGVQGDVLRNVMLEGLDADGRIERRLFADRVEVVAKERGILLRLEGGAQERGGRKTPFLDGRYRIFLPRADHARWTAAGVPGLSEAPER